VRRALLVLTGVVSTVLPFAPVAAEVGSHGVGVIVGGTPVAIAVSAPSGELAVWSRRGGGSGPRWTCGYFQLENGSSSGFSIAVDYGSGPQQPVPGEIYALICRDEQGELVYSWFGVYDPADPFAGLFAGERAAELALERLDLSDPIVQTNPPTNQLVGLPSWFWIDTPWTPVEVSAGVSAVTATVTARPRVVDWDFGDGARMSCAGPGTPYDPDRTPDSSGACTHVFEHPSFDEPGGVRAVTATVTYSVSWSATDGGAGDLGEVTRASTVLVRVLEVQAVIN
jgi:hypothetical protein